MIFHFEEFELDTQQYELRRAEETISIEPQVFDVLAFLIENRQRVVSKQEIFEGVWGDRIVSESALSSRLKAARKALDDSGSEQRLIKTLHGRGYRFVGEVTERRPEPESTARPNEVDVGGTQSPEMSPIRAVGRSRELGLLFDHLSKARSGFRQIVFVTGEAGLGKTILVEEFVDDVRSRGSARLLTGHCLEHHGQGEAFLPLLEAVGRACQLEGEGGEMIALLRRRAPSWLIEIPWLVEAVDLSELRQDARGMTRDRMLREMVEALEELTTKTPVVLVLEDLHWSDPSTVDLLTYLANRNEAARLLVIGTYRVTDARAGEHPVDKVVERLKVRNLASELPLDMLTEASIEKYLANRLPGAELPEELPALLQQRTDGNPLFMQTVVENWISDGALENANGAWILKADLDQLCMGVPESLRLLIERRLSQLPEEDLRSLESASVIGPEFPAAAAAAGVQMSEDEVEERCSELARAGNLLLDCEPVRWPDGTVCACFRFVHDVFQEVLYARIPAGRRARLHGRIGERLEAGYGTAARDRAAELASHFVEARAVDKAVNYLLLAAHQSLRRFAQVEGIGHLELGLELLATFPEDDRSRQEAELSYQSALAPALVAHEGLGSKRAEEAFLRARRLAEILENRNQQLAMIYGLAIQKELHGDFERSQELMEQRIELQKRTPEIKPLEVENYDILACSHFHQAGYVKSLEISEAGVKAFDRNRHSTIASRYGENPGIACYSWAGLNLWFLGWPERAMERALRAVELAQDPEQHYHLSNAKMQLALLHQLRQERPETLRWAEETVELSIEQGFAMRVATARLLKGWVLAMNGEEEGFLQLREGLDSLASLGAGMDRPYFQGLMADALDAAGAHDEALDAIDEALGQIHPSRSHFYQSELLRLRGQILLSSDGGREEEAETMFLQALELARSQRARSIELRTAARLAQVWVEQERAAEGRNLLRKLIDSFEEGHDLPDLTQASRVLGELEQAVAG